MEVEMNRPLGMDPLGMGPPEMGPPGMGPSGTGPSGMGTPRMGTPRMGTPRMPNSMKDTYTPSKWQTQVMGSNNTNKNININTSHSSSSSSSMTRDSQQVGPRTGGEDRSRISLDGDADGENDHHKIYLAVHTIGNKLGASYFDYETGILYLMVDITETGDYHFLKQLFDHVVPNVIITSSKQKEAFFQVLNESDYKETIEVIPHKGFTYELCKQRIYRLNGVGNLTNESTEEEREIFFSSIVSQNNYCMVCAAGGLLKYLDQALLPLELEEPGTHVPILLLKMFTLSDLLFVDRNTYSSLQIFHKELHPSVYKSFAEGKEGLSLYGIMNNTKSAQGSALLKEWFLRPSTNKERLEQRQDAISYLMCPSNIEAVTAIKDALKSTKNIMGVLTKMKLAGVRLIDWDNLYKTLFNAICLGDLCHRLPHSIAVFQNIGQAFSNEILLHMANLIKQIINFDESAYANHFVVNLGVDPDLDEKKRAFDGIPYLMTKVAQEELSKLSNSITKCSVTYLPQLGYLLNIPITDAMKESGNYDIDDSLDFKFKADDLVYYKSTGTKDLDQRMGDIHFDIRDHEMAIMHRLQNIILEHTDVIYKIVTLSAELDCLLSLASSAREYNLIRPTLHNMEENVIKIEAGRHLLQELCVNQFVPNNTVMSAEKGRIHILTAPNASGKSVYLKQNSNQLCQVLAMSLDSYSETQVGLIVYMAQIGSFVPAQSADISIRDALFTRIQARETVSIPLSTFMIDLNQVAFATANTTKHSLIIIDEFGKGTTSVDGLSLLCATLKYWMGKDGDGIPSILVSTHFHRLTTMIPKSTLVAHQTMDVMQTDEELVFLYKLIEGSVEHSHAYLTAQSAMIPDHILKRAKEVSHKVKCGEAITRRITQETMEENTRLQAIAREFLNLNLDTDDLQTFLNKLGGQNNDAAS